MVSMSQNGFVFPIQSPRRRRLLSLLRPGLYLKRWLVLLMLGITLNGLGLTLLLGDVYLSGRLPSFVHILALSFLPNWARAGILLTVGMLLVVIGVWQLNRSIVLALLPASASPNNLEMMDQIILRRSRRQGPNIVTIGGGTGMPTLLRGLRAHTDNITAIVTVADDGGSSGRIRRQMGMLPPGDFRNNMAALSDSEELMTHLLQYRFGSAEFPASRPPTADDQHTNDQYTNQEDNGHSSHANEESNDNDLGGHNFGNLFITAMAAITGSFEQGIAESSRVLAVRGRVLPSTLEHVTLCAEIVRTGADGQDEWLYVRGESRIPEAGGRVLQVRLEPQEVRAYPEAIRAILAADIIIAGPGSFYTSTLPNLLVPSVRQAIMASQASRIFICNVANQPGETDGYGVTDYMDQLRKHAGDAFTTVLANDNYHPHLQPSRTSSWVELPKTGEPMDFTLFTGDLINEDAPTRHDSTKLAGLVLQIHANLQAQAKSQRRTATRSQPTPTGPTTLHHLANH